MEIETDNAAEHFFPNPAFIQIYTEAITNALDAGASTVDIDVTIKSFGEPETISISIADNGTGFTDDNFDRFKRLLKPRDALHKGLGRLVYLRYFRQVDVNSAFADTLRTFTFSQKFNGTSKLLKPEPAILQKTIFTQGNPIPTPTFILSFDAIINDAEAKNSTFLNIFREKR